MPLRIVSINSSSSVGGSGIIGSEYGINASVQDNGDNTITVKYGFNANTLLDNGVIIGLGSSTMNGAGASSTSTQLRSLLSTWVSQNTNSTWYSFSLNGYFTDKFMPYGTSSLVDFHRNIDAALSLNPNIIILSLPSNDIAENTVEQFIANLIAIDDVCKSRNCYLFVTQTQPRNNYSTTEQANLRSAAAVIKSVFQNRCIEIFDELVDVYSPSTPARMKAIYDAGDSIHPNDAGHAYIFSKCVQTLQNFFIDQPYQNYRIERSTSSTFSTFTVIESGIAANVFSKTYFREDSGTYYYRVIGTMNTGDVTSNVTTLQQSIFVGEVEETINCNATVSTDLVGTSDWNDLVAPSLAVPAGTTYSSLRNSLGATTGISLVVSGGFSTSNNNGNALGTLYPANAARSYWAAVIGSSVDNIGDQSSIKFTGLNNAYTYTIKIFPSRASSDTSRILAANSQGKRGQQSAGAAGGGNKTGQITLKGLYPSSGEIEVYFGALIFGFGYVNAIVLEKNDNIFKVSFQPSISSAVDPDFQVNDINGPNITKVNFTGSVGSGLSSWNDINLVAGSTFSLNNSLGTPVALTISVNFISSGTLDNGASYGGIDTFPAAVLRYVRYRTLGFIATIGGCDTAKTYSLLIMATRLNATVTNRFTINGVSQTLYTGNNTSNFVTFNAITPDVNGRITINIDNSIGSGTALLSAMIIDESITPGGLSVSFDPSTASGITTDFNAIIPTKIIFDASTASAVSPDFTAKGNADPFVFDPSVASTVDPDFNTSASFNISLATAMNTLFNVAFGGAVSPYSFTKGHLYNGIDDAYIYIPAGYADNSNDYPLIVMMHGAGISTVDQAISQGPGLRINNGDRPVTPNGEKAIFIFPSAGGANTWTPDRVSTAVSYMNSNYRIDLDRVYITGLSLGGAGCCRAVENSDSTSLGPRNLIYSAAFMVCGSASNTFDYSLMSHMGWWTLHGTLDTTQNYGNTPKIVAGMQAATPRQPCLSTWFWGVGHNIYTTHTYDRFNKTNSSGVRVGGAAYMDWFEWIMKFSRDQVKNATLHVAYAEVGTNWSIQYFDYLLALKLVNDLSSSSTKTDLLARLASLKSSMDGSSKRYILDLGESDKTSTGNVNNMTSFTSGATASNLIDDAGGSSAIGFQVVTAAGTDTNGVNFDQRFNSPYYGLQANTFRDGMQVATSITTGKVKFTGLNNSKKYEIIILHISNNTSNQQKSEIRVDIDGVVKTEYSEMNTTKPIFYGRPLRAFNSNVDQTISPTAGEITINVQCNTGTFTPRATDIQSIILLEV